MCYVLRVVVVNVVGTYKDQRDSQSPRRKVMQVRRYSAGYSVRCCVGNGVDVGVSIGAGIGIGARHE